MPKIDFGAVEDAEDFSPLPDGRYLVHVEKIEETSTRAGDEMWRLWLQVDEGPHAGRNIFDNLVFSDAALKRVKLVCSRLGVDVSGQIELAPATILGKRAYVTVETEEYADADGRPKKRNSVPFAGYERADGESPGRVAEEDDGESDLPF